MAHSIICIVIICCRKNSLYKIFCEINFRCLMQLWTFFNNENFPIYGILFVMYMSCCVHIFFVTYVHICINYVPTCTCMFSLTVVRSELLGDAASSWGKPKWVAKRPTCIQPEHTATMATWARAKPNSNCELSGESLLSSMSFMHGTYLKQTLPMYILTSCSLPRHAACLVTWLSNS